MTYVRATLKRVCYSYCYSKPHYILIDAALIPNEVKEVPVHVHWMNELRIFVAFTFCLIKEKGNAITIRRTAFEKKSQPMI